MHWRELQRAGREACGDETSLKIPLERFVVASSLIRLALHPNHTVGNVNLLLLTPSLSYPVQSARYSFLEHPSFISSLPILDRYFHHHPSRWSMGTRFCLNRHSFTQRIIPFFSRTMFSNSFVNVLRWSYPRIWTWIIPPLICSSTIVRMLFIVQ